MKHRYIEIDVPPKFNKKPEKPRIAWYFYQSKKDYPYHNNDPEKYQEFLKEGKKIVREGIILKKFRLFGPADVECFMHIKYNNKIYVVYFGKHNIRYNFKGKPKLTVLYEKGKDE